MIGKILKKYGWILATVMTVVWGIGESDPLGISDAVDEKINEAWIKAEAILLPDGGKTPEVVVVLLSDNSFKALKTCSNGFLEEVSSSALPLVYADYAKITKALIEKVHAKLVFWDVYFSGVREQDITWHDFLTQLEDIIFERGQVVGFGFDLRVDSDSPALAAAKDLVRHGVVLAPLNSFGTPAVYKVNLNDNICAGSVCENHSVPYAIKKMVNNQIGEGSNKAYSKVLMSYPSPENRWECALTDSCRFLKQKSMIPVYHIETLCEGSQNFSKLKGKVILVGYDSSSDLIKLPVYGYVPRAIYQAKAADLYLQDERILNDKTILNVYFLSLTNQGFLHLIILFTVLFPMFFVGRLKAGVINGLSANLCYLFTEWEHVSFRIAVNKLVVLASFLVLLALITYLLRLGVEWILNEEVLPIYTVSSFLIMVSSILAIFCRFKKEGGVS